MIRFLRPASEDKRMFSYFSVIELPLDVEGHGNYAYECSALFTGASSRCSACFSFFNCPLKNDAVWQLKQRTDSCCCTAMGSILPIQCTNGLCVLSEKTNLRIRCTKRGAIFQPLLETIIRDISLSKILR